MHIHTYNICTYIYRPYIPPKTNVFSCTRRTCTKNCHHKNFFIAQLVLISLSCLLVFSLTIFHFFFTCRQFFPHKPPVTIFSSTYNTCFINLSISFTFGKFHHWVFTVFPKVTTEIFRETIFFFVLMAKFSQFSKL